MHCGDDNYDDDAFVPAAFTMSFSSGPVMILGFLRIVVKVFHDHYSPRWWLFLELLFAFVLWVNEN